MNKYFINGFIKEAMNYGLTTDQAIYLYKQAGRGDMAIKALGKFMSVPERNGIGQEALADKLRSYRSGNFSAAFDTPEHESFNHSFDEPEFNTGSSQYNDFIPPHQANPDVDAENAQHMMMLGTAGVGMGGLGLYGLLHHGNQPSPGGDQAANNARRAQSEGTI